MAIGNLKYYWKEFEEIDFTLAWVLNQWTNGMFHLIVELKFVSKNTAMNWPASQ